MKKIYALLAAGSLIGLLLILVSFSRPKEQGGSKRSDAAPAEAKGGLAVSKDAPEKSDSAVGPSVTGAPIKPSVDRREKVTSVREAYRQTLKEDKKSSRAADEKPPKQKVPGPQPTTATSPAEVEVDLQAGTGSQDESPVIDQPRLWLPAAMLEPDESIPITSELQVAEWEQLQEEFVQAVNGRAPSNETEKESWIRAQQENDDLFRAKFGWDAFRQQQLKAYMEGLAPSPPR